MHAELMEPERIVLDETYCGSSDRENPQYRGFVYVTRTCPMLRANDEYGDMANARCLAFLTGGFVDSHSLKLAQYARPPHYVWPERCKACKDSLKVIVITIAGEL
jgi:hypothetical protein